MGIAFDRPEALLLLPILVGLTLIVHAAARHRLGIGRRRAALLVRAILLGVLTFALAGFQLILPMDRLATVFVVDLSDSVGNAGREDGLAFLRQALAAMPGDDLAGVVAFGRDALVERLPAEVRDIDRLASTPIRSATDIGAALRLASALFPDDVQRRIVLLSDGNDTTGTGQDAAALAASRGIQIETRLLGGTATDEVLVERLTTPTTSRLGEEIEATATITSTVAQLATVRLFADGGLVETQRVDLPAGTTAVTFRVKPTEPGFHVFRAVVEAARDTFDKNNRADSDTIVKGPPRTLVVAGDAKVAAELVAALTTEHQTTELVAPDAVPSDLAGLANYDSVVLVDVPRTDLGDRRMAALQSYVRDLGRGLVMIGGPHSYGAGGYTNTPLEEVLPVDMGVRDKTKQPDIALVVVIDQSGSMDACHCNTFNQSGGTAIQGVRKVDIGKEAILRAVAALQATDSIGVVGFNEAAHWIVRTQPLGNVTSLQDQIAGIQPNGQTNIFAGLDAAVGSLETATATRRHIILLTDGWSRSGAYDQILARMKAAGITLSTVGAGGGAAPVLAQLAAQGGGRYYPAVNPSSIPDIFLKETQQVSGQQIVEEPFHPVQTGSSPILRGLDAGYPPLLGYNGTTAKAAAQTILVTGRDDPLLAQWQYGLGRSVAWTSDTTGRWAKDWLPWRDFSRFASQLVAWTFPGEETGGIEARFDTRGEQTTLHVESVEADGSPRDFYATTAKIVGPDLQPVDASLVQVAPGIYEAPLGALDPGAYAIRLSQTRPGTAPLGRTVGLVAPTATEYRRLGTNEALLGALRSATGGTVVAAPSDVWRHDLSRTSHYADLWPLLLVIAMLLWPLDVALRRVSLGRREVAATRTWAAGWRHRRVAARPASLTGMLAARDRAGSAAARAAIRRDASTTPEAEAAAEAEAPSRELGSTRGSAAPAAAPAPAADSAPVAATPSAAALDLDADTLERLRAAKRRARGG